MKSKPAETLRKFGIDNRLLASFEKQYSTFEKLSPIQEECIPEFLAKKDVIVQSPTGSGKTLSFVIPTLHILLCQKKIWKKWEIGALILLPNRELAVQVKEVVQKLATDIPLAVVLWSGGKPVAKDIEKFKESGANIIIATPGRFEALLSDKSTDFRLTGHLRTLEVLVLDEADRLLEMGFQSSLTTILAALPKQRRTCLFSATQVKEMEELVKTGLRNPHRITVTPSAITTEVDAFTTVTPDSLKNYYRVVSAEKKLAGLAQFLRFHKKSKILVFFSTCACVDYFSQILPVCLAEKQPLMVLHGKKKRGKRQKIFDQFRSIKRGVLICTDVMARGIDIPDIDWVVQYDPPRQASWFVHRSGRTGRCDKAGNALALLTPSEEDYIDFLKQNQKVIIEQLSDWTEPSDELTEELRNRIIAMAVQDRNFLERGSRAFVSYIQAYSKHDCHLVCRLDELDVCGTAHSFGLLRLPRMPELNRRDLSSFKRSEINTADIKYRDKAREAQRLKNFAEKKAQKREKEQKRPLPKKDLGQSQKRERASMEDWDDLAEDARLMKKLKKGKISKTEFDEKFLIGDI